jgi:acetyl-CoA carboxylase biotin carboxylase subunit
VKRILVANRGEIAVRVLRTCAGLGMETVLAASEADLDSAAARLADRTVCIGPSRASHSYLRREVLIAAALHYECDAIHPGYGFLAEDPQFAEMCAESGICFVGPSPAMLRLFGDKLSAREAARGAGVPVGGGSPAASSLAEASEFARAIGYPVMLKATKGGGGKGMRIVLDDDQLAVDLPLARAEAEAAFGDPSIYLERWVGSARHVEVQVAGSPAGEVIHLGDRDCTVQRHHQKLIEEAPAPRIARNVQEAMRQAAVDLCRHVGYDNVGTVEFLLDTERGEFSFLEVNPRIQVEHGVTELVTGIDIVALQLEIASTGRLGRSQADVVLDGCALECRINAEQPRQAFRASPGRITRFEVTEAADVRVDTHCFPGYFVPPYYDSLVAKVMVSAPDRERAIERMQLALADVRIEGVDTTCELAAWIVGSDDFAEVSISTRWLDRHLVDGAWPGPSANPKAHSCLL